MQSRSVGRRHLRPGTGWFLAGYAGLGAFFALEAATRERGKASSLAATADDEGTTTMIVTASAVAALLPVPLRRERTAQLPTGAAPVGLVVQAGGILLRAWAMRTLGRYYSRTLHTEDHHRVIEAGPYRWVRHPGYTGSLLTWAGFALTSGSLPVVAVVGGLVGRAYRRRIEAEEALLRRDLDGYVAYSDRTSRLIPFLW